ncbi:sensor domain-containing diguanylate cyclase [Bacillus salacetis]|uniref:Sensor domain-containing diguanylate cyclase n=1 Tax=Bacillus salacetis TaxID=2315464 RepID=A0A3A1R898_9BACI|nr:sensor domain-containing diguanylate cyclase [Bacillus salacetis]RIW37711.1 sensor domain-containing diguanylate cyclase [Bacillus salacetis]
MAITRTQETIIWAVWALLVPAGIYFTYQFFPPVNADILSMLAFVVFTIIISVMPIMISGLPILLIQWVSLAAFLKFGLFFEVVLLQIAIFTYMIRLRVGKSDLYRLPWNSIMFFLMSLSSGMIYFSIGGTVGYTPVESVFFPALIYQVSAILINQVLLVGFHAFLNREIKLFGEDLKWDFSAMLIMFPMGLGLFYLQYQIGPIALFLIGLPFISGAMILRLYNSSEQINQYLQKAVEIGHQLTESLQVNEVLQLFLDKILQTLPVEYAYILDVKGDELVLLRRVENNINKPINLPPLKKNEGISGLVWGTGKSALFHTKSDWTEVVKGYMPEDVESVLSVPIVRNQKVRGVLLLASSKRRAYRKYQLMIVDILCSYLGVAIANARHYETTKRNSEHCALTKLYNYRYFENLLSSEFTAMQTGDRACLSLIMLDIDHFKSVNDSYGHQSGNEILYELARRLETLIGDEGTVARYGGEEFVILLPDTTKEDAFLIAEIVRRTIADRPFILHDNLEAERKTISLKITASIGVAAAPLDADDSMALIRHADRALYTGAKQAGRNRVAEYVKSS